MALRLACIKATILLLTFIADCQATDIIFREFGIGDEFVTQSMEGKFDNTVVIMTGCSCLYLNDLA